MSANVLGNSTAQALEQLAWYLRSCSAPDATTAARAQAILAAGVKPTAIGQTASDAIATAVTASTGARSVVSRPPGDASKYSAAYRAMAPFQTAGSATLPALLDNLEGDAMQALVTAMITRQT